MKISERTRPLQLNPVGYFFVNTKPKSQAPGRMKKVRRGEKKLNHGKVCLS